MGHTHRQVWMRPDRCVQRVYSFLLFLHTILDGDWGGDFIQIPELSVNSLYHLRAGWQKSLMSVTIICFFSIGNFVWLYFNIASLPGNAFMGKVFSNPHPSPEHAALRAFTCEQPVSLRCHSACCPKAKIALRLQFQHSSMTWALKIEPFVWGEGPLEK